MNATKPQLSEEMRRRFDDEFVLIDTNNDEGGHYDYEYLNTSSPVEIRNFLATALEEQRNESTLTLMNTTKPFFNSGYDAGAKDERQKILSEVEGWLVPKRNLISPRSFGDGSTVDVSAGYNQAIAELREKLAELKGEKCK